MKKLLGILLTPTFTMKEVPTEHLLVLSKLANLYYEQGHKDEAREKLHANVNGFKTVMEWDDEWEMADIETKEDHEKGWIDHAPRTNIRKK